MGLLKRIFGGGPSWNPRPFYQNSTPDEYREWFAHVPPWNKVHESVLEAYIETLSGNKFFELFVVTAMESGLVPKLGALKNLADAGLPFAIRAKTAGFLSEVGQVHLQRLTSLMSRPNVDADQASEAYQGAMNAFESATVVEPTFSMAYGQLAVTVMLLGKREAARDWCLKGLAVVESQANHPAAGMAPEHIRQSMAEMEQKLRQLLRDIDA